MNYGLLTMITDGRAGDMEVWRRRDVSEFFYALWSHEDYLKEKAKARAQPPKPVKDGRTTDHP